MALQRSKRVYSEQAVQQPGVAQVNLRRLDLPLSQIFVPRLKLPHKERVCKNVQMPLDGCVCLSQRACDLGGVPDLPVIMRQHHPKSPERQGRHMDAKLG